MIFPEKCSSGEVNLKQLLVIKTLESVKSLPCTYCYTVGKALRHEDGQVHNVDISEHLHTHTNTSIQVIAESFYTEGTFSG